MRRGGAAEEGPQQVGVLIGARDPQRGKEAQAALHSEGLDVAHLHLDVTDPSSIASAAQTIAKRHGRLDALVNNAGIARGHASRNTSQLTVELLREVYETNVFGVVAVTNALIPLLRQSRFARVVNVSSDVGSFATVLRADTPLAGLQPAAYGSSKTALNMLTVSYAREFPASEITFNVVTPGYCATDLNGNTGTRSAKQGAQAAVDVVLSLAPLTGTFRSDGTIDYLDADGQVDW
ncbi:SDR family NAD(P)-dependent oxidoreductase [Natronoglycomyces albus]|uniref:SDR family NAD(P)-dependent oxidoreductase n=1 Tax=Natronoglycomyces albus TaxID=2811108 RepID=UPI0031B5DE14